MEKKKFNINLDDSTFTKERSPVRPLFKASTAGGQKDPEGSLAPQPTGQPLSYAEFIIQSKGRPPPQGGGAAVGDLRQDSQVRDSQVKDSQVKDSQVKDCPGSGPSTESKELILPPSTSEGVSGNTQKQADGSGGVGSAVALAAGDDETPRQEEGQRSEGAPSVAPYQLGSGSSIIVSPRQRGNPILKFVRSVPWEFGDIVPDYVLGRTTCALFLSVRYHNLNPNYIHERLKLLGNCFSLRLLLVLVDVKDPHHVLRELARISIMVDCTLILAWSPDEAGRYLETYKSYEKKPADVLKEQVEKDYLSKVTDCLTTVKSVNKTDAVTLLSTFSSIEGIIKASKEELVLCPGLGPQKAKRLYDVLHQPFLKSGKKDS
ncbi:DNA excision repair protein ERCC-1 [Clupea harengus]|uniref:DNA excision repair protein ERCC-1 n=1 Tax=Clupea harengus TaxID=7950 RepID=A0A6P8G4U2_CLUHA|nr:DNA excision repair protein ERCC-1 [Clupea harengus]